MKLKQYPKYKESGIQWIGKMSENWEIYRLKFLLSTIQSGGREEGGGANLEKGAFSLGGEHINWDGSLSLENERFISEEYYRIMNKGKIKKGDVLLVKDGATIGKTAIIDKKHFEKMAVNEHVFLMRPNKLLNFRLLYYLICSDSGFNQIKLTEVGSAQGGINQKFPDEVVFPISLSEKEQSQIASFLDKKTSEIHQLIEKDKKLIELLKEKRIALINHVVTRGLNPKAKMKDSGIEWIGEIPERWEVKKLKFCAQICNGEDQKEISDDRGIYPILGTGGEFGKTMKYLYNKPSVLLGRKGTIDKPMYIESPFWTVDTLFYTKINRNVFPKFFYYLSTRINFEYYSETTAVPSMTQGDLGEVLFPIPPKPEQIQIAEYLDKATTKIDQTVQKIEKKIELLEEYKKSLIHHVVTGKVDVRGEK